MLTDNGNVTVSWYRDDKVILQKYVGAILMQNVIRASEKTIALTNSIAGKAPIHVLIDVAERSPYIDPVLLNPRTIRSLINQEQSHRKESWVIVVDPNPMYMSVYIINGILRMAGYQFRVVQNMDAAEAFLQDLPNM